MRITTTVLFVCVVGLLALGMVMLFSASMGQTEGRFWIMQPVWCALGMVVCLGLAAAGDYTWIKKVRWLLLALAALLLVVVLVPPFPGIVRKINGACRWIEYRGMRFQPSELAKIALIVWLAWYGEYCQWSMKEFRRGLMIPGLVIGVVLGLIFLEPDWGTAILLAAVSGIILFLAGARWDFLAVGALAGGSGLAVMLWHDPVRRERWLAFLDLEKYKETIGFQTYQSVTAIGSGGWQGVGLGDSRQKMGFVPELHTDFIFSLIGEELGLIGTLLVLLAFLAILVSGLYIAWRARDTFGRLLAAGITILITLQAVINIGVVTSSLPNKGLPLPFISYGGSSLVLMLASIGILLNVARHAQEPNSVLDPSLDAHPALEGA